MRPEWLPRPLAAIEALLRRVFRLGPGRTTGGNPWDSRPSRPSHETARVPRTANAQHGFLRDEPDTVQDAIAASDPVSRKASAAADDCAAPRSGTSNEQQAAPEHQPESSVPGESRLAGADGNAAPMSRGSVEPGSPSSGPIGLESEAEDGVWSHPDDGAPDLPASPASAREPSPEVATETGAAALETPINGEPASGPSGVGASGTDGVQERPVDQLSDDAQEEGCGSTSTQDSLSTQSSSMESARLGGDVREPLPSDVTLPTPPDPAYAHQQLDGHKASHRGESKVAADDDSMLTEAELRTLGPGLEGTDASTRRAGRPSNPIPRVESPRRAPSRPSALDTPKPRLRPDFALPDAYLRWNRIVAEQCLLQPGNRIGFAYLSITPTILSAALEAGEGEKLSPEDASLNFASAVAAAYGDQVLSEPDKLWVLAESGPDGLPYSIAFVALSVLAAYQMHSDEDAGPNAYYLRLSSLLGCDLVDGHPRGFNPLDFANLWDLLSSWLEHEVGQRLALPGTDAGLRRYIAYPLGHVPLRRVDIEKLPDFFDWAGLEPGSRAESSFLGEAFQRWVARGAISQAGESAISDDRRSAVEAQLTLELEAWDGSWTDGFGRRTAVVHIFLDFRRRHPYLAFLPRRPSAFPAIFDDGSHVFESGEPGWYDAVQMTAEDGPELESGFKWVRSSPQGSISLHRPPAKAIALRPAADVTGYLSQRGLPIGIESAVLCTASLETPTAEFLSRITSSQCRALDHPAVPVGWRLFPRIVPRANEPPPPGLDALAVESVASVILRGGLRLGRRAAWLAGAPPTILIGGSVGLGVTIDGNPAAVHDGVLDASGRVGIGPHVVEAGRVRRRFEIVEPSGNWAECWPLVGAEDKATVALPRGSWTVLGARPDQVARATRSDRGSLVSTPFQPVWAVSVGGGPGATVLCLAEGPSPPMALDPGRAWPRGSDADWVSTIYAAHIRRPRFGWLTEPAENVELKHRWRSYWLAARSLKRRERTIS